MDAKNANDAVWGDGQLLCFSGLDGSTPHESSLVAKTTLQQGTGLDICLPAPLHISFGTALPDAVRIGNDYFCLRIEGKEVLGRILDAHHLRLEGECHIGEHTEALSIERRNGTTLIGVTSGFDAQWLTREPDDGHAVSVSPASLAAPPAGLSAQGRAAYAKAVSIMRGQVYGPEGRITHRWTTPDRWPHRDMWLWDSALHAIGWRHLDPSMARDAISAVFDCQSEDGFVPHMMRPDWQSEITQPPVLAYAAELVLETESAVGWVRELYPKLKAYLAWDMANRDRDGGGLLEWHIEQHAHCRSGESGCDNSPRFDGALSVDATDFNAFMANEYDCLARLALVAGHPEDSDTWREMADRLCLLINERLWDPEAGFYFDYDPAAGEQVKVWASSGFMPLLCGAPSAEMAAAMVAHMHDGGVFDTVLPLASVSPQDAAYSKDMWRGPSWLSHSWLAAEGLERYGFHTEVQRIRDQWCRILERDHAQYGTFFEYYDTEDETAPVALLRKGKNAPEFPHQAVADFGWTATLYVDWCHRAWMRASHSH